MSRKQTFYQYIETNLSSSGILSSEQISGIISNYSGPCPTSSKSEQQKYYRVRKTYIVKHLLNTRYLYRNESPTPLRVVAKEELFNLFEKVHTEGGKHLVRDRLYVELKKQYTGFSRDIVLGFLKSCNECQLQKCKKSLKSTVTKPLHSPDFASRGQIDVIDMQTTSHVNRPYHSLLVYQDHMTKFVVLRPIKRKTTEEVINQLLYFFLVPLTFYRATTVDSSRMFIWEERMARKLWPGCRIVYENRATLSLKVHWKE